MANIKVDFKYSGIDTKKMMEYADRVIDIHKQLHKEKNNKDAFLGWLNLPSTIEQKELEKIKKCANKIRKDSEILVVIGIGGSYLGTRAVIESLTHTFYNLLPKEQRKSPQILYVGNNISGTYLNDLVELIGDRDLSVNVISKSGTTTEPAIAFRFFREFLENKYGLKEARRRI